MKEEEKEKEFDMLAEAQQMFEDDQLLNAMKLRLHKACGGQYKTLKALARSSEMEYHTLYAFLR